MRSTRIKYSVCYIIALFISLLLNIHFWFTRKFDILKEVATQSPTSLSIIDPPCLLLRPPSRLSFTCLHDDQLLWNKRAIRGQEFVDTHCHGEPIADFYHPPFSQPIPVLFVFWNEKNIPGEYRMLSISLNTAAKFNNRVILLLFGRRQDLHFQVSPNVEIYEVLDGPIREEFDSFASIYVHQSPNPDSYERFCFQRWFGIHKFLEIHHMDNVFVVDNDVLVLRNVTYEIERCYVGCRTVGVRVFSLFVSRSVINEFLQFIREFYHQKEYLMQTEPVSDMWVHELFMQEYITSNPKENQCYEARVVLSRPEIVPHQTFDGLLNNQRTFIQDELGLPVVMQDGYVPTYAFSLHFSQPEKKHMLANCSALL